MQYTERMTGLITFEGNPYPNGHAIKDFEWFATQEDDGSIFFQLHLEAENYWESKPANDNEDSDWTSTIVWENYEHCIVSSVQWGNGGFKVADSAASFDFDKVIDQTLAVDVLDEASSDDDDPG